MKHEDKPAGDSYRSISASSEGLYKDRGSKFISFAFPVENTDEVKACVAGLKKRFYDATHHCYAYRIGRLGRCFRANDDGEPSYSAGKPILDELKSMGLSDVLVVVVRYFGGVKLGVPGLIKAYRSAAADALSSAAIVEKTESRDYTVSFDYSKLNDAMKAVKDMGLTILGRETDLKCSLDLKVRLGVDDEFKKRFQFAEICQKA
ncbi:MAG: YigZ family protein [Bacteroidales bacterium]|jgi:uncharacterized YigZ family protein|nr:YigZ family protein [Bacteroidales bacterium]MCI2122007.1 YigZ family protein [Bacteroidales bacterium]MCI2145189.1 YigZ family protein [Bacteroidales bacterium]